LDSFEEMKIKIGI